MTSLADIGMTLPARRVALGLTQRALAARLGVKQPQVARWESTGYRTATLERVSAVAETLGVDAGHAVSLAAESPVTYSARQTDPLVASGTGARALDRLGVRPAAIAAFCRSHGVREMSLFGSAVRTDFGVTSDVDVLVTWGVGRQPASISALADIEEELAAIFRRSVDLVDRATVEVSENPVRRSHILNGARPIYVSR